jgi:hypothetical protein
MAQAQAVGTQDTVECLAVLTVGEAKLLRKLAKLRALAADGLMTATSAEHFDSCTRMHAAAHGLMEDLCKQAMSRVAAKEAANG